MKKHFVVLLAFCVLCMSFLGCDSKQNNDKPHRPERDVIKDIIDTFDSKAEDSGVSDLLSELEEINAEKAVVWSNICDTWGKAYKQGYVHENILPDGLPTDDSLCIVVLGYALNPDGSMTEELIGRLQVAYASALKYPKAYILLAGGGTAANNPTATEADAMAAWLLDKGIARKRIIVENKSMTTLENASNSLNILSKNYPIVSNLAMVTSDYHVPWGTVNYEAAIQYMAYKKNIKPAFKIVSNAGYQAKNNAYTYELIDEYQKSQLWELEAGH